MEYQPVFLILHEFTSEREIDLVWGSLPLQCGQNMALAVRNCESGPK